MKEVVVQDNLSRKIWLVFLAPGKFDLRGQESALVANEQSSGANNMFGLSHIF